MPSIAVGQLLHLRLFLEGVEIPVISATVTAQIGSPATAQIEIVPTDRALLMLPRTTVHLFYLDYEKSQYDSAGVDTKAQEEGTGASAGEIDEFYHLFFCGEVFSMSYAKSGFGQRSVVLQCLDFSNMWDTNYLYMLRYQSGDPGDGQGTAIIGDKSTLFGADAVLDDIVNQPELVVQYMAANRKSAHNPALQGTQDIVGSLFSILELLGGVHGKHFGVNAWATVQERRIRLLDQLGGDSGETASKIYEQSIFEEWIRDRIGSAGAIIAFRDIINIVNGFIYYGVAPHPVASYQPGAKDVPDWITLDTERVTRTLAGGGRAGDPQNLVQATVGKSVVNPLTGALTVSDRENGLNPFFLQRLDLIEKGLVDKGWSAFGRGRPQETSLVRLKSNFHHGLGHAADLILEGHRTGFSGTLVTTGAYDNLAIAKRGFYGRMHYHFKFKGVNSPATAADFELLKLYRWFWRDFRDEIKKNGLRWGGNFGLGRPVESENGVPFRVVNNPYYNARKPETGGPTFREYVWAHPDGGGFGWDPVHVDTGNLFTTKQIISGLKQGILIGSSPEDALAPPYSRGTPVVVTPPSESVKKEKAKASVPRERLLTQIFRPDVWFVPPPACNIVFPEEYVSFTYNRQMLREVTRLELQTFNNLYDDDIVNNYFFAPKFENEESLSAGGIGSASKAIIYPHERFSGIVPKMERIAEVAFYASKTKDGTPEVASFLAGNSGDTAAGQADSGNTGVDAEPENLIEKYAGRVASFNFLTQRYASRTAALNGRFMPRLICGFPMLAVNRPVQVDSGTTPVHFIGLVSTLSHTMSQGGGNTSATLTHLRSHKTGDDTDDLFARSLFTKGSLLEIQKTKGTLVETTIVVKNGMSGDDLRLTKHAQKLYTNEFDPATGLKLGTPPDPVVAVAGVEVGFGVVAAAPFTEFTLATETAVEAEGVVDFSSAPDTLSSPPPGIKGAQGGTVEKFSVSEQDLFSTRSQDSALFVVDDLGNSIAVAFTRFTIVERVGVDILPLEEAIRPPWFSEEYSNERIGPDVYQKLFGCPSLTDARTVTPAKGSSIVSIERAADAIVDEYSAHSEGGREANPYIYGTTTRRYATLTEVMGSFHAEAFGNKTGLDGLDIVGIDPPLTSQLGTRETQQITEAQAGHLDPRQERRRRVQEYLDELLISRGLRG